MMVLVVEGSDLVVRLLQDDTEAAIGPKIEGCSLKGPLPSGSKHSSIYPKPQFRIWKPDKYPPIGYLGPLGLVWAG